MRLFEQVMEAAEQIFEDGEGHTVREIREKCELKGIPVKGDKNIVNNVLTGMKRRGLIQNGEAKGLYVPLPEKTGIEETSVKERKELAKVREANLDWNRFFVLKPDSGRCQEMKLSITEKGEIRLNSRLQKEIPEKEIEIIFSKDYKTVLLNPGGRNSHVFTKAGTTRNRGVAEVFAKMKIEFPVFYMVEWNAEYAMWLGKLKLSSGK